MERRLVLCMVLSLGIFMGYAALMQRLYPSKPTQNVADKNAGDKVADKKKSDSKDDKANAKPLPEKPLSEKPAAELVDKSKKPATKIPAPKLEPEQPEQWVTLGSADEKDPYRMLVTLTTKGAAVSRIELNSPLYCDIDNRSGYLGHLVMDSCDGNHGCEVQVVGPGTPAAEAGLKPSDIIKSVNGKPVTGQESLEAILGKTKPNRKIKLKVLQGGKEVELEAKLRRRPLEVIKPEGDDPLSMLLTLDSLDELKLPTQWARDVAIYRLYADLKLGQEEIADLNLGDVKLRDAKVSKEESQIRLPGENPKEKKWVPLSEDVRKSLVAWLSKRGDKPGPLFCQLPCGTAKDRLAALDVRRIFARVRLDKDGQSPSGQSVELDGVNLRTANWIIVKSDEKNVAKFRRTLPEQGLEVTKIYRLAKVPKEFQQDGNFRAYHLEFSIEIRNIGDDSHKVAYRLDGPNGLPTEGKWYASKVSRNWGGAGLRDFVISMGDNTPEMTGAMAVADGKDLPVRPDTPPSNLLTFVGVDAQYFSAVLMPERDKSTKVWFEELMPLRIGKVNPEHKNLTNTSCRLISVAQELKPGETTTHKFTFFTGPKKPAVLEPYQLGELVYFGWPIFRMVAVPLTHILHVFYSVVGNYGLAIIMLTILVRGCMFPLSLKQAAGAQKMQILQPEMKKLHEVHKNNQEARAKAQQELFRKHNYNPLSGCLPIFIQMPIFIGLYRTLMVAIELRDAPLLPSSIPIRWCSNLAGPDMLYDWHSFMPDWFNAGVGIFALGPYFNILPLLTIVLFIVQQKIMMPPAADEQAAMQQKMMKYMMIFMGLMFYKVASGLCIYFIVSSLWGLIERRFLPKTAPVASGDPQTRADVKARARQAATKPKK